jgi:hypothetical protein
MRYRGENLVENSVNEGYREGYRERPLEIASVRCGYYAGIFHATTTCEEGDEALICVNLCFIFVDLYSINVDLF